MMLFVLIVLSVVYDCIVFVCCSLSCVIKNKKSNE